MDILSSRYTQTTTPTGFNLTISSLVTADGGVYHCGIAFRTSAKKSLTIYYNTKDVNIIQLYPKAIEITFIAFPDPNYKATVKQDGVQLDVNWNVYKSTQASGAIKFLLQNSTAFTNQNKIYTVHVNITSPVSLDVEKNITWVSDLTTQSVDDCVPESFLGLSFGVVLGNIIICVICLICIVILAKRGATDPKYRCARKRILILCFSIICIACFVCIVILATIGKSCALKLGLGLGLGLGIPFVGCLIVIAILVKKEVNIQDKDEFQEPIPEGSETTIRVSVHGFHTLGVQWNGPDENILTSNGKYNIQYDRGTGISTLQISALEITDSGLYTCHAIGVIGSSARDSVIITVSENRKIKSGPPAIHIGTKNNVKSETTSKKTNDGLQPLLHATVITDGIPKHCPQPTSPENSDVEDRNLRGIHVPVNFDDSQDLPTDILRFSNLPPLTQKQPTVEEEDASENPKQKQNKKKKGKVNEGNPEEMVELYSKRKLPEDQSDDE